MIPYFTGAQTIKDDIANNIKLRTTYYFTCLKGSDICFVCFMTLLDRIGYQASTSEYYDE
jgi:hypothetical protein